MRGGGGRTWPWPERCHCSHSWAFCGKVTEAALDRAAAPSSSAPLPVRLLAVFGSISWELVSIAFLNYHLNAPSLEWSVTHMEPCPLPALGAKTEHFHGRNERMFSVTSRADFMSLWRRPFPPCENSGNA